MRKLIFLVIFSAFITTLQISNSQSLEQVLQLHFDALGQERLSAVISVRSSGKAVQLGTELPFVQVQKRPNMIYLELDIQGSVLIQASNGREGWAVEPWTGSEPRKLDGPELHTMEQMAGIDSDLVGWHEKGYELQLIGPGPSEDAEHFILQLKKEEDEVYRFYIDAGSYLIHKIVTSSGDNGNSVKGETIMSDYRKINGINVPFRIEMVYGGQTLMTNLIETVEFDITDGEDYFTSPF